MIFYCMFSCLLIEIKDKCDRMNTDHDKFVVF
jgi:hypothetical protein